ncbi:MAG TPA: hypothetical protein VI461_07495, partial [Chitinophagaceae bacterium]|nr:hypothetical protein [Chitinophagaceae bacterium]
NKQSKSMVIHKLISGNDKPPEGRHAFILKDFGWGGFERNQKSKISNIKWLLSLKPVSALTA